MPPAGIFFGQMKRLGTLSIGAKIILKDFQKNPKGLCVKA